MKKTISITLILTAAMHHGISWALEKDKLVYEDDDIYMRIVLRTADQLSAFYQGREYPRIAIDEILKTCFVTPIVKNKKFDYLWLELAEWQFNSEGRPIKRIDREYWKIRWREVKLSQAHQSTFGWTLMPEWRDLRFDEGVGGSVVIPMQDRPFTLAARFKTGEDKKGPLKRVTFEGLKCLPQN